VAPAQIVQLTRSCRIDAICMDRPGNALAGKRLAEEKEIPKMASRQVAAVLGAALAIGAASPAAAQMSFEQAVIRQLECRRNPDPLPILEALEKAGRIRVSDMLAYDSMSCFRISGGIEIAGMTFRSVCAHEERAEVRARRPDLIYRGPGTSPGQLISFGTPVDDNVVAKWYLRTIGVRHLNEAIDAEYTNIGDNTEVSCSSWFSG